MQIFEENYKKIEQNLRNSLQGDQQNVYYIYSAKFVYWIASKGLVI